MAQKVAANTFAEGLNQDLSPLATKNNMLTDALNATIISRNGNELSLQNDMGNTKLVYKHKVIDPDGNEKYVTEDVKLKEGYVPVGMKEYGGIVYIISTSVPENENEESRMEIGSFPGPKFSEPVEQSVPDQTTFIIPDELSGDYSRSGIDGRLLKNYNLISTKDNNDDILLFRPCDAFNIRLFGLDWLSVSEGQTLLNPNKRGERKLFTYKIVNINNKGQDITSALLKQGFQLGMNQYGSSFLFDDKLKMIKFRLEEEDKLYSLVLDGQLVDNLPDGTYAKIHWGYDVDKTTLRKELCFYTCKPLSGLVKKIGNAEIPSSDPENINQVELHNTNKAINTRDGFFYFPNIKKGNLSIQFQLETIDAFNLCQINKYNKVDYSFGLKIIDNNNVPTSVKKQLENYISILDKFNNLEDVPYRIENSVGSGELLKEGVITIYGRTYDNIEHPYCTITIEKEKENDKWNIAKITLNDKKGGLMEALGTKTRNQYYFSFPSFEIQDPSWVKVNEVLFDYKIKDNETKKTVFNDYLVVQTSPSIRTLENSEGHENIYDSGLIDIDICTGYTYLYFKINDIPFPVINLGLDSNGNYCIIQELDLNKAKYVRLPIYALGKNYTFDLEITPINTDYNIDLSAKKIKRSIDLSKSRDLWLGTENIVENTLLSLEHRLDYWTMRPDENATSNVLKSKINKTLRLQKDWLFIPDTVFDKDALDKVSKIRVSYKENINYPDKNTYFGDNKVEYSFREWKNRDWSGRWLFKPGVATGEHLTGTSLRIVSGGHSACVAAVAYGRDVIDDWYAGRDVNEGDKANGKGRAYVTFTYTPTNDIARELNTFGYNNYKDYFDVPTYKQRRLYGRYYITLGPTIVTNALTAKNLIAVYHGNERDKYLEETFVGDCPTVFEIPERLGLPITTEHRIKISYDGIGVHETFDKSHDAVCFAISVRTLDDDKDAYDIFKKEKFWPVGGDVSYKDEFNDEWLSSPAKQTSGSIVPFNTIVPKIQYYVESVNMKKFRTKAPIYPYKFYYLETSDGKQRASGLSGNLLFNNIINTSENPIAWGVDEPTDIHKLVDHVSDADIFRLSENNVQLNNTLINNTGLFSRPKAVNNKITLSNSTYFSSDSNYVIMFYTKNTSLSMSCYQCDRVFTPSYPTSSEPVSDRLAVGMEQKNLAYFTYDIPLVVYDQCNTYYRVTCFIESPQKSFQLLIHNVKDGDIINPIAKEVVEGNDYYFVKDNEWKIDDSDEPLTYGTLLCRYFLAQAIQLKDNISTQQWIDTKLKTITVNNEFIPLPFFEILKT